MNRSILTRATTAIAAAAMLLSISGPAEAKRACKRINKTEGALLGGAGGAILGKVILGGTGGTLAGAAAGGVAGHEIARKKHNKYCRK
jgi:osmotically inducible lipoprotein OsmB